MSALDDLSREMLVEKLAVTPIADASGKEEPQRGFPFVAMPLCERDPFWLGVAWCTAWDVGVRAALLEPPHPDPSPLGFPRGSPQRCTRGRCAWKGRSALKQHSRTRRYQGTKKLLENRCRNATCTSLCTPLRATDSPTVPPSCPPAVLSSEDPGMESLEMKAVHSTAPEVWNPKTFRGAALANCSIYVSGSKSQLIHDPLQT